MAKETKKEKMHNRYIAPTISGIVAGIAVAITVSFFKINPLENKIQVQDSLIQKLEHDITTINTTLQEQNILINRLQNAGAIFEDQAKVDMLNQQNGGTGNTQTNAYKNE